MEKSRQSSQNNSLSPPIWLIAASISSSPPEEWSGNPRLALSHGQWFARSLFGNGLKQLLFVQRFCDVVVDARLQALFPITLQGVRGHGYDRHVGAGFAPRGESAAWLHVRP